MAIEEEHQDVLQNLEFAIISIYQETPDLIDAEVLNAIDALICTYGAEAQGKSIGPRPIRGISSRPARKNAADSNGELLTAMVVPQPMQINGAESMNGKALLSN